MTTLSRALLMPLCGLGVLFSVASTAAENVHLQPPVEQPHGMPPFHGEGMLPPPPMMMGFCHPGQLFCASVASENPTETIQKLTSVLPATTAGKHYEVRLAVVEVPDHMPMPPQPEKAK
ncbi:hypothetical protein A9993_01100 [Rahnella victoriana]|uniref:hypothetical protein n=1 Tax=Rahnella victoriana TaxID=1510570 RepID=UPI000BB1D45A|nr:hypothetical protein [Rahnella victoriana]PBI78393.1 hypothetical protein A9993_01100 [Rahnella victoriana]